MAHALVRPTAEVSHEMNLSFDGGGGRHPATTTHHHPLEVGERGTNNAILSWRPARTD